MNERKKSTATSANLVRGAFGEKNRARLLELYFSAAEQGPAWKHIYSLLLWVNSTTGLAHCYESDKCQPGKPWYGRSLAFHSWLSEQFGSPPMDLAARVDWLFRRATRDLAEEVLRSAQRRLQRAAAQRQPFADKGMPQPGEDPELVAIVRDVLGEPLTENVSREQWLRLVERIREYLALENKRKNLVGEGFEDVITATIRRRLPGVDVSARRLLHSIPGFNRARQGDKPNKVDVAVVRDQGTRTLVTAKWSVRADREKQFRTDFGDYVAASAVQVPFEYVLVTNEFDPARLMRACGDLAGNAYMFAKVVHISTDALRVAYGASREDSISQVLRYMDSGRLIGFDQWLDAL